MSTALGTVEPDADLDDGGSVALQNLLELAFRGQSLAGTSPTQPLRSPAAAAYPATIRVERKASRSALVAFEGNRSPHDVAPGTRKSSPHAG
jgi:hypothetical protein